MKLRVAGTIATILSSSGLLLGGCTDADWANTMNYIGVPQQTGAPAPAPVARMAPPASVAAAAGGPDPWCEAVATDEREHAAGGGFDAATQQRRFTRSYTQCVAIFGNPPSTD